MGRKPLGELLVEAKLVTPGELRTALAYQRNHGGRLGEILLTLRLATEPGVMSILSRQLGTPYRQVGSVKVPHEVLRLVPRAVMERNHVLPVRAVPGTPRSRLLLAMAEPQNLRVVDEVSFASGASVTPLLTSLADIERGFRLNGIHGVPELAQQVELEDGPSGEFIIIRDACLMLP